MADAAGGVDSQTVENVEKIVEAVKNVTERIPATPEGMAIAYSSLVIMALVPIFFGSFRSVKHHKEQKESGKKPDIMTNDEAMYFPLIASVTLFVLYIFFQVFSMEYINQLVTGYFFFLGVLALCHLLSPIVSRAAFINRLVPHCPYLVQFGVPGNLHTYNFTSHDILCLAISTLVGVWYILKKHWIANNMFGIAFAINGVELFHLNKVVTGCILLSGLFIYDIFWVFGTNVMVTVAKSFEAPIKLVFPQDLLEHGLSASNFAMLGLGDIVVPGIFIALLLRFDKSLKRNTHTYFYATFAAYLFGLLATIFVMHVFKHAQPALLYLVPCCLVTPLALAMVKGDLNAMFIYEDHSKEEEEEVEKKSK